MPAHDKAPVAEAIGAFSFASQDAAARGIEPLAAAGWVLRGSNPLQRLLDPERHRCANDLAQLRRIDRLRAALDQQLSEFGRCFFAETRLSFSSWARCSRSFFKASRAVGLDWP